MTCLHEEIKIWYFEDTNQPAGMWSCKSCGHKFVPLKLWAGLTDEDMKELKDADFDLLYGARWAEAKLKEKNNG